MNLLSTIGRGIKGAGRGILSGIDNAAVGSLAGGGLMDAALGSNGQPFTPTDQQRKGLRGQYLMGIGSALQQGRPIAEGIQQYQQNAIGQIQAGQQAQYQNQQRVYRQMFLTEMQAATTDDEKMKVLSRWGAMFPKEVQEFGAMMKELRPPENENMGAPFAGQDGQMYQGMKKGDPRVIPGMKAPNNLQSTGDGTGAMYDSSTGLTSPFRMNVNGMPMMVRENKKTGQFFNAADMAAGPISQNPVLPYDKPSPPRTIKTAQGFFQEQPDGSYAPIKTASDEPVMPYNAPPQPPAPPRVLGFVPDSNGGYTATEVRPGMNVPRGFQTAQGVNAVATPTAAQRGMGERAATVDDLDAKIRLALENPLIKNEMGPISGRLDKVQGKFGTLPKDLAELQNDLISYGAFQAGLHPVKGIGALRYFEEVIGGLGQEPAQLLGKMDSNLSTSASVQRVAGRKPPPPPPQQQPSKVYNPKTMRFENK